MQKNGLYINFYSNISFINLNLAINLTNLKYKVLKNFKFIFSFLNFFITYSL